MTGTDAAAAPAELRGSPLLALDRAFELMRRSNSAELFRAFVPGIVLSVLALGLYYAERVEGVRSLRSLFALSFTGAYVLRAVVLGRWAGRRVDELLAPYRVPASHGSASGIARASLWVALDLWFWLWLLVLAVHLNAWVVPFALPILSVRGALVPSWLASADAGVEAGQETSGFGLVRRAVEHAEGQRRMGIILELMLILGVLGIAINLLALGTVFVTIGQDMLGLDLAFVNAFLSSRNYFALLLILLSALTLIEPLRAALSAVLFTEALLTREGIIVRSLVTRAAESPRRRVSASLTVILLCALFAPRAFAQDAGASEYSSEPTSPEPAAEGQPSVVEGALEPAAPEEPCEDACQRARSSDDDVRVRSEHILADKAFAEFPEENWNLDGKGDKDYDVVSKWIERLLKWLSEHLGDGTRGVGDKPGSVTLPPAWAFLGVALVLAVTALAIFLSKGKKNALASESKPEDDDPLKRPAEHHLEDALALASRDLRAALRSLYLATLVGLERRQLVQLAPERTNGQYLRSLPQGDDRTAFGAFTRIFDAVHYGARDPSFDDFTTCRRLAEQLIAGGGLVYAHAEPRASRGGVA